MNALVLMEGRFLRTPKDGIWTSSGFAYPFWARYLEVFQSVRVVARVGEARDHDPRWLQADGPNVTFAPIPYYLGPLGYALHQREIRRAVRDAFSPGDAVIFRLSTILAAPLIPRLQAMRYPYAVELVGDPWEVFAPGAVRHPLRSIFRRYFFWRVRREVAGASAVSYVTEKALQRRYPPPPRAYVASFSSVELTSDSFVASPVRPRSKSNEPIRIVAVGTLEQLYKGQDVLIDAVGSLVHDGFDLRLSFVGDGKYRQMLTDRAAQLGIASCTRFCGLLPAGSAVRAELDSADLFVMPSRTEGLPRALLEAMARGLPCIASAVGGIPELLEAEDMFPAGDWVALANKLREVIRAPERRQRMAERNLARAHNFSDHLLAARRREFYQALRDQIARARS